LTDARVCVFARNDFDRFAREHPELEHKLLERTLAELDRTRSWMMLLGRKTAPEKIATFLLDMSDRYGDVSACTTFRAPQAVYSAVFATAGGGSARFDDRDREPSVHQAEAGWRDWSASRREVEILNRPALSALAG
jgi:CRP/FNR family transcriptional regulator